MKVANFGPLMTLGQLRPLDYRNYLKAVSAVNKAVKKPQFHVAISAPGKTYDKQQLTTIAAEWMERMGYGKQPYIIVFHKDTRNNHVHIVSTRVNQQSKKIRDSYEQIKAQQQMNIVMGLDEKRSTSADADKALSYCFQTKAQLLMILESMGYAHKEDNGKLTLFKFGKQQAEIDSKRIENRVGNEPAAERKKQLTAWFYKYTGSHDTIVYRYHGRYQSAFSVWLKEKMGIELVFHASGDKPPYGYTVIDHAERNVFKGGEIMPLKELLSVTKQKPPSKEERQQAIPESAGELDDKLREYYAAILKVVLHNYPDVVQGLYHHGITLTRNGDNFYFADPGAGIFINGDELLDEKDYSLLIEQFDQSAELQEEVHRQHVYVPEVSISDDVDDEAILGRNRRHKKRARTNHR